MAVNVFNKLYNTINVSFKNYINPVNINDVLPKEILTMIFSMSSVHDLSSVASTCKLWSLIFRGQFLWLILLKKYFSMEDRINPFDQFLIKWKHSLIDHFDRWSKSNNNNLIFSNDKRTVTIKINEYKIMMLIGKFSISEGKKIWILNIDTTKHNISGDIYIGIISFNLDKKLEYEYFYDI